MGVVAQGPDVPTERYTSTFPVECARCAIHQAVPEGSLPGPRVSGLWGCVYKGPGGGGFLLALIPPDEKIVAFLDKVIFDGLSRDASRPRPL